MNMYDDPDLLNSLDGLSDLADMGYFDKRSAAYGIALQCFHDGYDSLSDKQKYIFDNEISPVIGKSCLVCGNGIELEALPNAYEEGKMLCSYHMNISQK